MSKFKECIKDYKGDPDSYAIIAIKGNDVAYMFEGSGELLVLSLPVLQKHIEDHIEKVIQ